VTVDTGANEPSGSIRRSPREPCDNRAVLRESVAKAGDGIRPVSYGERKLADAHPDLAGGARETYLATLRRLEADGYDFDAQVDLLLERLGRIIDLRSHERVLVVGCGPRPQLLRVLLRRGFEALGIEPVRAFAQSARDFLDEDRVIEAPAESLDLPDGSQDIVLCLSVLEHVESPSKSLDECFRVLSPGGLLMVTTTNRHGLSPTGQNGEYNVRFFNWLPRTLQESFVFKHLHFDPDLANWSLRPAVHWFTYSDLCRLGREARFCQFYSIVDMLRPDDSVVRRNLLRRLVLRRMQLSPWLRAIVLTLTQRGGTIVMLKRPEQDRERALETT